LLDNHRPTYHFLCDLLTSTRGFLAAQRLSVTLYVENNYKTPPVRRFCSTKTEKIANKRAGQNVAITN
jgi:hypothetical protein